MPSLLFARHHVDSHSKRTCGCVHTELVTPDPILPHPFHVSFKFLRPNQQRVLTLMIFHVIRNHVTKYGVKNVCSNQLVRQGTEQTVPVIVDGHGLQANAVNAVFEPFGVQLNLADLFSLFILNLGVDPVAA